MATFTSAFFSFLFGIILTIIVWGGFAGPESLGYLMLFPIGGILLLLMGLTGIISKKLEPEYYPKGIFIGLVLGVIACLVIKIDESINRSKPAILKATYYNEEGLDLYLRSDQTFMVIERNLLETRRHYGDFTISGDSIRLSRSIELNGDILSPELYFEGDKILFYRSGPHVRPPNPALMYIKKDKIRKDPGDYVY